MRAVDISGNVVLELRSEPFGRLIADGPRASLNLYSIRSLREAGRALGTGPQRRARLDTVARALSAADVTVDVRFGKTTVAVAGAAGPSNWAGRLTGLPFELRPLAIARAVITAGIERNRRLLRKFRTRKERTERK